MARCVTMFISKDLPLQAGLEGGTGGWVCYNAFQKDLPLQAGLKGGHWWQGVVQCPLVKTYRCKQI